MPATAFKSFHSPRHDHRDCVAAALARAESLCRRRGARLTRIRRRVLELIWAGHRPQPAYELLAQLRREKRNATPPTIYRALDFLLENRLAHKIESLNAYIGCPRPQRAHAGQFLICDDCRQVAELDDPELQTMVEKKAARAGLKAARQTIEIRGQCPRCRR